MKILRSIGEALGSAIDYVSEKKRKFDKTTRIKRCIKHETSDIVKNYIKLGKYYYAELRNVPNNGMQNICSAIDNSRCEIKRLKHKLEEIDNGCDIKCYCDSVGSFDEDSDICSISYSENSNDCCNCKSARDCCFGGDCNSDDCFSERDCGENSCGDECNEMEKGEGE